MSSLAGLSLLMLTVLLGSVNADIDLTTSTNETLQFPDREASFTERIPKDGVVGVLHSSSPSDGCTALNNYPTPGRASFVIMERGGLPNCMFEAKVRHAQDAGFQAVIVYNNNAEQELITMAGNGDGINIHAVFVTKLAGEKLLTYADDLSATCYIRRKYKNTGWSVFAVSVITVLAITAVFAIFSFIRRHRLRRPGGRPLLSPESPESPESMG